jgi:hypothetical protein
VSEPTKQSWSFALESGIRHSPNTIGFIFAPGVWIPTRNAFDVGLFAPWLVSARADTVGLEGRVRHPLGHGLAGEIGFAIYPFTDEYTRSHWSYFAGINLQDAVSFRLSQRRYSKVIDYESYSQSYTKTSLDVVLTNRTGKIIGAVGLGLLGLVKLAD